MVQMQYGSSKEPIGVGKVSRTGDTMDGFLGLVQQFADGEPPDANDWGQSGIRFYDANEKEIGLFDIFFRANGLQELVLRAQRAINGTEHSTYFALGLDNSGNPFYDIQHPDALRKAVGISDTTLYSTLADLITEIKTYSTGDIALFLTAPAVNFYSSASALASVALVMKASSNNAYYLAFSRDKCAIGNISLANGTVSVKHDIV